MGAREGVVGLLRHEHLHDQSLPLVLFTIRLALSKPLLYSHTGAGGDDEFQGLVDYTFTRPDGTQLGTQGKDSLSQLPWPFIS